MSKGVWSASNRKSHNYSLSLNSGQNSDGSGVYNTGWEMEMYAEGKESPVKDNFHTHIVFYLS